MAFITPRMSLKIWNAASDPYDHEQLADNFLKLDQHDHSQGRGTAIGSDGIRDGAITGSHIYPGTLGADSLAAGSVDTTNLADNSVTVGKLDTSLLDLMALNAGGVTRRAYAEVLTDQTAVLAVNGDLATAGPSVTVTVPTNGLVLLRWELELRTTNGANQAIAFLNQDSDGALAVAGSTIATTLTKFFSAPDSGTAPYTTGTASSGLIAYAAAPGLHTYKFGYLGNSVNARNRKLWAMVVGF